MTSSRVQLLDTPVAAPGVCALCGSANKRVVDFGKQLDWYGAVYFCEDCIREIAEAIGFIPVDPLTKLNNEHRELRIQTDQLRSQIKSLKETLSELLLGTECSCKSNPESDNGDVLVLETPEPDVETNDNAVSRDNETEQSSGVEGSDDLFSPEDYDD